VGRAVERLVLHLPPKERACVLLKDVLDYSLEEIAEFVGSTSGGVKAALSRGRGKLAALAEQPPQPSSAPDAATATLLSLYVERFNRHDWAAVRELISADARLLVADRYRGPLARSPYFGKYEEQSFPWFLALGQIEAEPAILILPQPGAEPASTVRLTLNAGRISDIRDYHHCPWILRAAEDVHISPSTPPGASTWNS
jgi:RNA polymerase sigma-70 factor, ECF subfamily